MSSPFDYSNNISQTTTSIWSDETSDGEYSKFMVNRALSQFYDTVMFAQEMNTRSDIPNKWHYEFLRLAIQPKKRRFAKWYKPEQTDLIKEVSAQYNINMRAAESYLSLLNNTDVDLIIDGMSKGGRNGKR